jgi:4-hydroxybenzoate polyprenyltransferase
LKIIHFIVAMRPYQWTKNLIIFAALMFSKRILDPAYLLLCVKGFFVFCFLSGSVYIFNDVMDRHKDRLHPKKKNRPIASGRIKPAEALAVTFIIAGLSVFSAFRLSFEFGLAAAFYLALVFAYSIVLKRIVILDVLSIAIGFVARAVAGGLLIRVEISDWLLIVTVFLALFLGFSKRRSELINLDKNAGATRPILDLYSVTLLDQLISITAGATLMSYALYTLAEQTIRKFGNNLWLTLPIVVYIVFRYFYLVYSLGQGSDPSRMLLKDRPLLIGVLVWVAAAFLLVYHTALFG